MADMIMDRIAAHLDMMWDADVNPDAEAGMVSAWALASIALEMKMISACLLDLTNLLQELVTDGETHQPALRVWNGD